MCTLVAVISTALLLAMSQPIAAVATFLMYYAGGVGVRERSPYAAAAVLLMKSRRNSGQRAEHSADYLRCFVSF